MRSQWKLADKHVVPPAGSDGRLRYVAIGRPPAEGFSPGGLAAFGQRLSPGRDKWMARELMPLLVEEQGVQVEGAVHLAETSAKVRLAAAFKGLGRTTGSAGTHVLPARRIG